MAQGNTSSNVFTIIVLVCMGISGIVWVVGVVRDARKLQKGPVLARVLEQLEYAYQDFLRGIPLQMQDRLEAEAESLKQQYPESAALLRAFASVIAKSDFAAAEATWRQAMQELRRQIPKNRWTLTRIGGTAFGVLAGAILGWVVGNPAGVTNLWSVLTLIWSWVTRLF